MKINLLLTGAGAPGMPGILKCIRASGDDSFVLIGADMNPNAACKHEFEKFYTIPPASDDSFIPELLKICSENHIDLLISCITRELFKLSQAKKEFEKIGTIVGVMDYEQLKIANNKGALLSKLKEHNIDTPEFYIAQTWKDIEKYAEKLGYPDNGFCVKGVVGNGSRAVKLVKSYRELADVFFDDKPNNIFCSYSELKNILTVAEPWPCSMMVMEALPGMECAVDLFAKDGKVISMVCRRAPVVVSSNPMQCVIEQNPYIENLCKTIVEKLNLSGNIGFDFKEDSNGIPKILEINPRFTCGIVACFAAGINFPYLGIMSYLGHDVEIPPIKYGVKMVRRLEELFFDENGKQFYI